MGTQISNLFIKLCVAIRFLTIMPISWKCEEDSEHFSSCLLYFPLVGAIIGGIGCLLATLLLLIFPQQVVAVVLLVYFAAISGFLHLDGLSDSADGLLSSRPRAASLSIMKDSRVGAMGVVAVVAVMLGKYSALESMDVERLVWAVFLMPVAGRCSILITMAYVKYARPEGGIGGLFYTGFSKMCGIVGLAVLIALSLLFAPVPWYLPVCTVLFTCFIFNRICTKRLGGATGDTLGAVCELTETTVAMACAVSFSFL